ncbi:MAG: helix-turn-helix domain-containing protein [Oscillospiraceae bacterium]|nr:helix-turn-helix domain-containing protein [Oscillospiraceae bacterium]
MFFERFNELAKKENTSVNAIAKVLVLSSGSVTAWKNGTKPSVSTVYKIANYFNVSTDYLLGRTDDPTPKDAEAILEGLPLSPEQQELLNLVSNFNEVELLEVLNHVRYVKSKRT